MPDRVPSLFVLVPGPWREPAEVQRLLLGAQLPATVDPATPIQANEVRVTIIEDAGLSSAFAWGRRGRLPTDIVGRIAAVRHAALLECGFRLDQAPRQLARIGRLLRDAGGLAVRMEASGAASTWEPWLEQLESNDLARVYATAVLLVQGEGGAMFTCGMHHFDLPDAEIQMAEASDAAAWLDTFNTYQLVEAPALLSGHTFHPDADLPKRVIERWPDHRHHPSDGRHNPFGIWRFLEPGVRGVQPMRLPLVLVPPLVTLLVAAERSAGRPLSRDEVERLLGNASAIAMEPRDALQLERSRGYADIEPERAWEQWQLVRTSFND